MITSVLGMVTPLGCRVEATWKRLIEGSYGKRAITPHNLKMNDTFDNETRLWEKLLQLCPLELDLLNLMRNA